MQWTPGPQAGFSTNPQTWLPVNPNHVTVNVQSELEDPQSLLNWYRTLIALRRTNPALSDGKMTFLDLDDPDVLVYRREGSAPVTVLINFSGKPQRIKKGIAQGATRTLATTDSALAKATTTDGATLPAYAAWIVTSAQ